MDAVQFIQSLRSASFSPFMGVPCSVFTPLINRLGALAATEHFICSSEGEAMGLAGGFALSGRLPVVYMQNDGFGNAVNPLSSLQMLYRLPALLLISWRGEPGLQGRSATSGDGLRPARPAGAAPGTVSHSG